MTSGRNRLRFGCFFAFTAFIVAVLIFLMQTQKKWEIARCRIELRARATQWSSKSDVLNTFKHLPEPCKNVQVKLDAIRFSKPTHHVHFEINYNQEELQFESRGHL
jgi:hypothetical protein